MAQFVTFRLKHMLCGINIYLVREFNKYNKYTPIPLAPDFIVGFLNLRGKIVTIIDLAQRIGVVKREGGRLYSDKDVDIVYENKDNLKNLILKTDEEIEPLREKGWINTHLLNDNVGFLVDSIEDVIEIDPEQIQPPPANLQAGEQFISGVVELDNDLLILLDVESILDFAPKEQRR